MHLFTRCLAGIAAVSTAALAFSQVTNLTAIPSGSMTKIGFYMPHRLELSSTKPAGLKKEPTGLIAPSYGVLTMQGKPIIVIVDRPDNGPSKLYIDTNGDGDLTNDAPADWKTETRPASGNRPAMSISSGGGLVQIKLLGKQTPVSLKMYMFDKNDPQRAALKNTLLYYSDYALEGTVQLGSQKMNFLLDDMSASGSFQPPAPSAQPGPPSVLLLLDRLGTGKYVRQDQYDASKPFNIGGVSYELKGLTADGSSFTVARSTETVAEVPMPVDLSVGKKMLAFSAKTTDGHKIEFPGAYKGKVVLLDFWATWCGPCMEEVPNVVANYNKFHDQGFEILGISLDNPDTIGKIPAVTKEKGMTWQQVADGKYWKADVAVLYGVDSIPRAYLVDGDTGEILALGDDIRGEGLAKALQAAVAKKNKNKSR